MKTCSINGCERKHRAKGLCQYHITIQWRKENPEKTNKHIEKYIHSFRGHIFRTYGRMKQRVQGKGLERSRHLYFGLDLLNKEDFIAWASKDNDYKKLHENWIKLNYDIKFTPSIDRIDSSKGYILDNIRWITNSENCILGNQSKKRQL